jgi:hypothetical protein
LVTFEGLDLFIVGMDDRIADADVLERFDVAYEIAHFAGLKLIDGSALGDKLAEFEDFVVDTGPIESDFIASFDFT